MKVYLKIADTGGYPEGVIPHMIHAIKAIHFQLNYFYDADILKCLANGPFFRNKSDQKKS